MTDYNVTVTMKCHMDFSEELNILAFPNLANAFGAYLAEVFDNNEDLKYYISDDLTLHLEFPNILVEYTFSCHDENEKEAESFADYMLTSDIRDEIEEFGCKILKVTFDAQEADLSWYDDYEARLFGDV